MTAPRVLVLTLLLAGCAARPPAGPVGLDPDGATAVRRAVVAWLECGECSDGELEAVVKLGETAVPSLVAHLREGPAPARQEALRRHLVDTYESSRGRIPMGADEYVRRYSESHVALTRVRAATALGAIGGASARRALEEALALPQRDDVMRAIRTALARTISR